MMSCNEATDKEEVITILQTADIHAQLNPHSELFVENDSIVFRNAGGLGNIKTLVESVRKENPDGTVFIDGSDLIQGSGESIHSEGKIFPSLVQQMNYDLLIPGNWEVIYCKQVMLDLMDDYKTNNQVTNIKTYIFQDLMFWGLYVVCLKMLPLALFLNTRCISPFFIYSYLSIIL